MYTCVKISVFLEYNTEMVEYFILQFQSTLNY
jgi:hypothetical protein